MGSTVRQNRQPDGIYCVFVGYKAAIVIHDIYFDILTSPLNHYVNVKFSPLMHIMTPV